MTPRDKRTLELAEAWALAASIDAVYGSSRATSARAALVAHLEQPDGGTLEENVKYLLDQCPYTVRELSGDCTGTRGKEDLTGSLSITFLGMQHRLQKGT